MYVCMYICAFGLEGGGLLQFSIGKRIVILRSWSTGYDSMLSAATVFQRLPNLKQFNCCFSYITFNT